jgi:hypothetical protein
VTLEEATADAPATPVALASEGESSGHERRFGIAYLVLGILAGLAIAAAIAFDRGGGDVASIGLPSAWSSFVPQGATPFERRLNIAAWIGPRYVDDAGHQVVQIEPSHPYQVALDGSRVPIEFMVVNHLGTDGLPTQFREYLEGAQNLAVYNFCGPGASCSIATAAYTQDLDRLVRREALEVAMYTFAYSDVAQTVLIHLPSVTGQPAGDVLLFRRTDLTAQLAGPVDGTLAPTPPTAGALATSDEGKVVDSLTTAALYGYKVEQLPDGNAAVALSPASGVPQQAA